VPRPRFERLPEEKKERILEAAAQEFAVHGFDGASLNQILERAEISKGAAYYYFDDKADFFATVVHHYWQSAVGELKFSLDALTAETFWPVLESLYAQQFARQEENPWMLGLVKAASQLPEEMVADGPLAGVIEQLMGWLGALLQRGRELRVVRDDLPEDLLLRLVMAIDDAGDRWLLDRWEGLEREEIEHVAALLVDALRRVLEPRS
jgi:AcrR family transcriptional regulator